MTMTSTTKVDLKRLMTVAVSALLLAVTTTVAQAAVVTFTEIDGDVVTVKTKLGTTAQLETALGITNGSTGINGFTVDFIVDSTIAAAFAGTDLSIKASGHGDKLANFVHINAFNSFDATSIDLGKVTVKGELVYIDAGDGDLTTPAIAKLDVTTWRPDNNATEGHATSSEIHGNITEIKVKGDFDGLIFSKDAAGALNFQNGDGTAIGKLTVGDDIAQRNGNGVGHIQVHSIERLTVKGTFFGSSNGSFENGLIETHSIGPVNVHAMDVNASIVLS